MLSSKTPINTNVSKDFILHNELTPIFKGKVCPYCGKKTELIDSAEIYSGTSYGWMYICRDCDAYVGCHKHSKTALGRLANAKLRDLKKKAHEVFD